MAFIGKSPQAGNFIVLDSITTSATATYNLTRNSTAYFPASARNLIVSLNGITQAPDTAYSVSGSTITFSSALTSSDVIDYILVLGDVLTLNTPADNTVGINQLNVSDGTSGQALTTDGSGTLSFSTVSSSTPTLDAVTGAGATTTNAITVGNLTSTGIDDNSSSSTALTINANASAEFSGDLSVAGSTGVTSGNGFFTTSSFLRDSTSKVGGQLYFGSNLGDVISLYDDRLGDANMYGFGVESSALFSRSLSYFNWYVNQTNDGSSWAMQLNGNGRLVLKGAQSSSNAAEVYFMDDASPGLVGGIEFTGSLGNGGNYNSSLQSSGELQYSAAGHFFADTSVVSSGIPGAWHRMNGDFRWGTYSGSTVITEAILMASSTGNLDIDGTLYQNSASTNSDSKMKENVVTLTNCLNKVSQLRGVEFDWKEEYRRDASHDIGVIAQEVETVIPEIVTERELQVGIKGNDGETIKSVDYSKFTAILIEAVKELKAQNEALETRIAALESN
jgi:hypothetical protein